MSPPMDNTQPATGASVELLPCPFCAAFAVMREGHRDHWRVECSICRSNRAAWQAGDRAKQKAADVWNTRASLAQPAASPDREKARYHFTDEAPFPVQTREGTVQLGSGWLAISEEEYASLTATRPEGAAIAEGHVLREDAEDVLSKLIYELDEMCDHAECRRIAKGVLADITDLFVASPKPATGPAIPAGMKPWAGGDSAPDDIGEAAEVLHANGSIGLANKRSILWGRPTARIPTSYSPDWETAGPRIETQWIIAYTPKPATPDDDEHSPDCGCMLCRADAFVDAGIATPAAGKGEGREGWHVRLQARLDAASKSYDSVGVSVADLRAALAALSPDAGREAE